MDAIQTLLIPILDIQLLSLFAVGTFAGIYVGAIPSLSVTMAVSILISFTFTWEVYPTLALMIGTYMVGVYGGLRTAIPLNIPGAPAAIATALDGYPMAQKGMAGEAIGIVTEVSFIGGFVGIFALAVFAPLLADFVIRFQPRNYMFLALLGILLVGSLSGESLVKGIFACALGIGLGAVGMDPLTFTERFTFGTDGLRACVSFVAVMVGMLGISEGLMQLHTINTPPSSRRSVA